jgi:hypothetical protein|nr:MAG TPA: Protein of unknown function (DUF1492) [Caudoviricetes sp.]
MKMIIEIDNSQAFDPKEREMLVKRVNDIDNMIMRVNDPIVRNMINDKFVKGYSKRKTSIINNYTEGGIYRKIYAELDKIL